MISKSEWNSVNGELRERRDGGDPPTFDEVLAYSRGELPPEEEERVRELLVSYPELARTMFASVPEDEAKPGEPGYVSDVELAHRRAVLQERLHSERPALPAHSHSGRKATRYWAPIALAATLVIVSGLYIQSAMEVRNLSAQLNAPRVAADERLILPDARRGGVAEGILLDPDASSFTLVVPADDLMYRDYRLEIIDYETQRAVWRSETLQRKEDNGTFSIFFRREFLRPGDYQVVVFGVAAGREEKLDTHTFSIPRAAAH
jgi:hypothetical protein